MRRHHKHNWALFTAEGPFQIKYKSQPFDESKPIGVRVVCTICGKTNTRLSKKFTEIIKNTAGKYGKESQIKVIKIYDPSKK